MIESELVDELSRRAGLSSADVRAVVNALATVACEQERRGERLAFGGFTVSRCAGERQAGGTAVATFTPGSSEIDDLIAAAGRHPLGVDFLMNGDLCSVAIVFRTHAFTVDAARERLRRDASIAGS
jgi:hypothetical protein